MDRKITIVVLFLTGVGACLVIPPALAEPGQERPAAADRPNERAENDRLARDEARAPRRELREPEEGDSPPRQPGRRDRPGPGGPRRPGMPMRRMRPPMPENEMLRVGRHIALIERMRHTSFDPAMAGLVALGALRTDVRREKPEDTIKDLEGLLPQVKTLGLRNSIRMMLKDLYREIEKDEKVLEHLKALVLENDAEIQKQEALEKAKTK